MTSIPITSIATRAARISNGMRTAVRPTFFCSDSRSVMRLKYPSRPTAVLYDVGSSCHSGRYSGWSA